VKKCLLGYFCMFLLAVLVGAAHAQESRLPRDRAALRLSYDDIQNHLAGAAQRFNQSAVDRLIDSSPIDYNYPGLIISENAAEHEMVSMRKLASALYPRLGYSLMLVSSVGKLSVPAFDGVVLDYNGRAIANFSLKRPTVMDPSRFKYFADAAFVHMSLYSDAYSWMHLLQRESQDFSRHHSLPTSIRIMDPEKAYRFQRKLGNYERIVSIFAPTQRAHWLLVDATGMESLSQDEIDRATPLDTLETGRALIVMTRDKLYAARNGQIDYIELNQCANAFDLDN
jgi:hypothetical protein